MGQLAEAMAAKKLPAPNFIFQRDFGEISNANKELLSDESLVVKIELIAQDVKNAIAIYTAAADTFGSEEYRLRGGASDLTKMSLAVTLPKEGMVLEPEIHDLLKHRLMTLHDSGLTATAEILLHLLKNARDAYMKAAEGWVSAPEEGLSSAFRKYLDAPRLRQEHAIKKELNVPA